VMRGAAMKVVQELLGHATIEMTMRYSHLTPDVSRDAVQLLDGRKSCSAMAPIWHPEDGAAVTAGKKN
jgi:hypothetical protein